MKILLGYCGPTDCCLSLYNAKAKKVKQYAIETIAWQLLSLYWDIYKQSGNAPKRLAEWIWKNRDKDII